MRRLLEAFATFEYQKGIVDVSLEPVIWETISEKQRSFFENLMYRFILHGESHLEDQAKSVDFDFYIHNSKEEKIKTAQYVLCLIYTLNPKHLEMRFVGQNMPGKVAIEQIKKWCDSIN